jgi:predicted nucleic acid-binding protein
MSSIEVDKALLDSDVFISYFKGDEMVENSDRVVKRITNGELKANISSMLFDDIITGLRSKGMAISEVMKVLLAIASIEHTSLPVTSTIAVNALMLYERHGGARRLHYFDSFHVATAKINDLPIITSDGYIIEHRNELGIQTIDLETL